MNILDNAIHKPNILTSIEDIKDFLGVYPLLSLSIRVTNNCNLKCIHCYSNAGFSYSKELTTKEILDIVRQAYNLGAFRIFFTGGEPFLRKDIIQILRYAKSQRFTVYISTNSTLVTKDDLKEINTIGVDVFQVSIDGPEEINDEIRGVSGAFQKAVTALNQAKRFLNNTTIVMATVILRENKQYIKELYDLACKIKVDNFAVTPLHSVGRGKNIQPLRIEEIVKVINDISHYYLLMSKNNKEVPQLVLMASPKLIPNKIKDKKFGRGYICTFPYMLAINSNGDIAPCDGLFEEAEWVIGNIRKETLYKAWGSSKMKYLRNIKTSELIDECRNCDYKEWCMGGCRASAYIKYHNWHMSDPLCHCKVLD